MLVCPGLIESGKVKPLVLKPVPVTLAWVIVRTPFPVLPIRIVWEFVEPTVTLPKLALEGVRLIAAWRACAPVPVREMVSDELVALLVTVTLPDALPTAVGANTALRVAVAAAFNVKGTVIPFTVNPVPLAAMLEIWTAAVPVLLKMMDFVALLPVLTLPKLTEAGFACNCPNVALDPVPAKATVVVGLTGSLLVMDNVAAAAPAAVG